MQTRTRAIKIKIMKTKILESTKENIAFAARVIKEGGLVAFPTETVYGLGADALNEEAVKKIYRAKGRPSDNPMICHISSIDDMNFLTDDVNAKAEKLMRLFSPGPITVIVRKSEEALWLPLCNRLQSPDTFASM